jgi:tetratricopeptide (TPR) repeat protein
MLGPRMVIGILFGILSCAGLSEAQAPVSAPPSGNPQPGQPPSDLDKVERVLAARREYQIALEQLRMHYLQVGDYQRAKWAEDELVLFHRILKQPYRLELDVPPPSLKASYNIPEANELYRRAMGYKDKGWGGTDFIDNQRRAELLFQQILTNYPQSDKIDDSAFQLGDIYESKPYRQYQRAAQYYERCFQWNPNTQFDARLRAARIYDHQLQERTRALELYKEIITHETETKRIEEAEKRVRELSAAKKY